MPNPHRPLLALAVIARDEEANLPGLAASVAGIVDEMVLCDTGSSDRTVQVSRELGFRVGERPWDDSFAAARNASWELTDARWILTLDCDERLIAVDPGRTLRDEVAQADADGVRALVLRFTADTGDGRVLRYTNQRVHARDGMRWTGRIHERAVDLLTGKPADSTMADSCRIEHHGYTPEEVAGRGKRERNLTLALAAYTHDADVPLAKRALEVGRAMLSASRPHAQAGGYLAEAHALRDDLSRADALAAASALARCQTQAGDVLAALDTLAADGTADAVLAAHAAELALSHGLLDPADAALTRTGGERLLPHREDLFTLSVPLARAQLAAARGRHVEAIDTLLALDRDWPGHPAVAEATRRALVAMGATPDGPTQ